MSKKRIARKAKTVAKDFMKKQNVIGVGVGEKWKNGKNTHNDAMIVLVKKKIDKAQLTEDDLLPSTVTVYGQEVPVDVIAVGNIRAENPHRFNHRPLVTGVSCGHFAITAGTIGLYVEKGGLPYLLSNNHVIANSNDAAVGDPIYQPGPIDGGRSRHTVAHLSDFVPIDYTTSVRNKVDAAIALLVGYEGAPVEEPPVVPPVEEPKEEKKNFLAKIWEAIVNFFRSLFGKSSSKQDVNVIVNGEPVEQPTEPSAPQEAIVFSNAVLNMPTPITGEIGDVDVGDAVQKSGRTTGYTTSTVIATGVMVSVEFGAGQNVLFEDQTIAGDFSAGGDSGSAIFDMQGNAVGLLFAGSDTVTIFTPMKTVFSQLGIDRIWR